MGKPENGDDAFKMLMRLSGRCHEVITAICLRTVGGYEVEEETTRVYFRSLCKEEILAYIASGDRWIKPELMEYKDEVGF